MHLRQRLKCTIVITRCPSAVVSPSVVNFSHFRLLLWNHWAEFKWNLTRSKISTSSTKFVFFGPIGKTRAAAASDWPRHFRILLWNRRTEFHETWQEARSQRFLLSCCFSGRSRKKMNAPASDWLRRTFSTSHLKAPDEQNSTKLDRKQELNGLSYQICVFRANRKKIMAARPLIFYFSESAKISTEVDRKQDINVLYQVCGFLGSIGKQDGHPASDWLKHFRLLLWNSWAEFNETWQEARPQRILLSYCFSGRSKKKTWWLPRPLIGWDMFEFLYESAKRNSTEVDRKQDLNVLYQVCVFGADQKNKMTARPLIGSDISTSSLNPLNRIRRKLTGSKISTSCTKREIWGGGGVCRSKNKHDGHPASDWLRHFRLLIWNRSMEFNETWQEESSQRTLPSLCFSGRSE